MSWLMFGIVLIGVGWVWGSIIQNRNAKETNEAAQQRRTDAYIKYLENGGVPIRLYYVRVIHQNGEVDEWATRARGQDEARVFARERWGDDAEFHVTLFENRHHAHGG
jgi:hypothetical protein